MFLFVTTPPVVTDAYVVEERLHVGVTDDVVPSDHVAVHVYVDVPPVAMLEFPDIAMDVSALDNCVTVQICGSQPVAENVIFPVREEAEVFADALNETLPLPLPDVAPSVSHDASFETVHDVFDVTLMVLPELAAEPMDLLAGEIESEDVTPDCVTVQICGSQPVAENVIFPVREEAEVFADALNETLPLPLPDVAPSVSQDASFETVHDVFDVTLMVLPELAAEPMDLLAGEIKSEDVTTWEISKTTLYEKVEAYATPPAECTTGKKEIFLREFTFEELENVSV